MKSYPIVMEIAGPLALYSRPDTGGAPTSFPVPTWSAAKGTLESIARLSSGDAWFHPTAVEVCRRRSDPRRGVMQYQGFTCNYGGPLRKSGQIKSGASLQIFATVLSDVCFRIHAEVRGDKSRRRHAGANPCHQLQQMFQRRLERGQCHRTPCLGISEFTASYWGPCREDQCEVDRALNLRIPSLLVSPFSSPVNGKFEPKFQLDARIEEGRLAYAA